MKWIGQHIYDLISRFRSDVYLEDVSTGTIASGGNLGLDSNNKIVKATEATGDLTSIVAGTGLSGTSLTGPIPTLNVEASQPGITTLAGVSAIGTAGTPIVITSDAVTFQSVNADDPIVTIKNTSNAANDMASLKFVKDRGATPGVGDNLAEIYFIGEDSGQNSQEYGRILCETDVVTDGQESGQLKFGVANHDGGNGYGLIMTGGSADGEVDVTVGLGTASVTTLAGTLTMGSTATIDNSGVWVGGVIPSAKLDTDTAHLAGAQTFTGTKTLNSFKGTAGATVTNILDEDAMGSDSATALATQQSIKAYADTKSLLAGSSSVTTLGTIGTGVWEGTAIASDQQKHLMHYQVQGYSAGSSNYVAAKVITDVRAPFLHSVDIGSDGLDAQTIQVWMRTGGHTMPNACTLKRFTGWTAAAGSASQTVALFRVRLQDDVDSDPEAVLLQEVTYTASGNATANFFNVTTASSGDAGDLVLAAGDIVFSALKGGSNPVYFNGTFEVEF